MAMNFTVVAFWLEGGSNIPTDFLFFSISFLQSKTPLILILTTFLYHFSIDGMQVRVRLVDLGQFRTADASNIGNMQWNHTQFPLQSTGLFEV